MQDFLEGLSDKPFDTGDWESWEQAPERQTGFAAIPKASYRVVIRGFSPTQGSSPVHIKDGALSYVTLDFQITEGEFANRTITFQKVFAASREGADGISRSGITDLFKSFGLEKPATQKDVVTKIQGAIDSVKPGTVDFDSKVTCQKCRDEQTLAVTGIGNLDEARKSLDRMEAKAKKAANKKINKVAVLAWSYDDLPLMDPKDPAKGRAEGKECPRGHGKVRAQGNITRFLAPGGASAPAGTPTTPKAFDAANHKEW